MSVFYPRDRSHSPFYSEHPPAQTTHSWDEPLRKWVSIKLCQTYLTLLGGGSLVCLSLYKDACLFLLCFSMESRSHHHFTLIGQNHADRRILDHGHSKWQICRPRQKWKQNQAKGWVTRRREGRKIRAGTLQMIGEGSGEEGSRREGL